MLRSKSVSAPVISMLAILAVMQFLHADCAAEEYRTRYYALLIGQTYAASAEYAELGGTEQDVAAMRAMLTGMDGTPYQISVCMDLTADGILNAVSSTFAPARDGDVCLLYYAGHGHASEDRALRGALVGTDGLPVPLGDLCSLLYGMHGEFMVILDSCYSGSIVSCLVSAGTEENRHAAIHALCAVGPYEKTETMHAVQTGESGGAFTRRLVQGCTLNAQTGFLFADRDHDAAVSLMEAYFFARMPDCGADMMKSPVLYPENSACILVAQSRQDTEAQK